MEVLAAKILLEIAEKLKKQYNDEDAVEQLFKILQIDHSRVFDTFFHNNGKTEIIVIGTKFSESKKLENFIDDLKTFISESPLATCHTNDIIIAHYTLGENAGEYNIHLTPLSELGKITSSMNHSLRICEPLTLSEINSLSEHDIVDRLKRRGIVSSSYQAEEIGLLYDLYISDSVAQKEHLSDSVLRICLDAVESGILTKHKIHEQYAYHKEIRRRIYEIIELMNEMLNKFNVDLADDRDSAIKYFNKLNQSIRLNSNLVEREIKFLDSISATHLNHANADNSIKEFNLETANIFLDKLTDILKKISNNFNEIVINYLESGKFNNTNLSQIRQISEVCVDQLINSCVTRSFYLMSEGDKAKYVNSAINSINDSISIPAITTYKDDLTLALRDEESLHNIASIMHSFKSLSPYTAYAFNLFDSMRKLGIKDLQLKGAEVYLGHLKRDISLYDRGIFSTGVGNTNSQISQVNKYYSVVEGKETQNAYMYGSFHAEKFSELLQNIAIKLPNSVYVRELSDKIPFVFDTFVSEVVESGVDLEFISKSVVLNQKIWQPILFNFSGQKTSVSQKAIKEFPKRLLEMDSKGYFLYGFYAALFSDELTQSKSDKLCPRITKKGLLTPPGESFADYCVRMEKATGINLIDAMRLIVDQSSNKHKISILEWLIKEEEGRMLHNNYDDIDFDINESL